MNQYMLLRRMFWPIMLLVFGVTAILNEYTGIGYDKSWPIYVIAWGILKLAENAVLAQNPPPAPPPYPGYPPPPGSPYGATSGSGYATPPGSSSGPTGPTTTAIVPSNGEEGR